MDLLKVWVKWAPKSDYTFSSGGPDVLVYLGRSLFWVLSHTAGILKLDHDATTGSQAAVGHFTKEIP